jgi:glyoxylase-like metal-dependent hydrolase (beta-lactamase superfamily II)
MTRPGIYTLCLSLSLLLGACSEPATESPSTPANADPAASVEAPVAGIDNRGGEASGDGSKWWHALPRADWSNYTPVKTYHPWFEVYEIQNNIYAIYEPGQFEEVISWLIVGSNQALLFDTGLGMGDIRGVVKQLTKKPITVLNSHGHYDHTGGNYQFDTIIARNHPFTIERAKGTPHEKVAEFASGDWIWKQNPPNFDPRSYQIKPYGFSRWIEEHQFIDLGGVSLEIIYTPGHAPDGIVLIDHQRRLMFTGDTFYPAPLYAHLDGSNFLDYAQTAQKLAGMVEAVDYLLPSHNVPLANSDFLLKMDAAFQAIIADTVPWQPVDGGREYGFEGFSILTPDPPVDEDDFLIDPL